MRNEKMSNRRPFWTTLVVVCTVGLSLFATGALGAAGGARGETGSSTAEVAAHSALSGPSVVLSASGASGNGTSTITLGLLGSTGSSFMTTPTPITITNNGGVALNAVALKFSDQHNNSSLQGSMWACLHDAAGILVNEPLTTVENYGQVSIGTVTLLPGATYSYTVIYYAGTTEDTGCGGAFTGYRATPGGGYSGAYVSTESYPAGATNPAARSLTNPAEGGSITPTMTVSFEGNSSPETPVALATPSVSITNIPSSAVYLGSFSPTYTTSGDGTVFSSTSTTPSVCTVDSSVVKFVGVGTCSLVAAVAAVAATNDYNAASGSPQRFAIGPATPTVSITNMPISTRVGGSFTPTYATSGDGAVFSSTSSTPSVCTVDGSVVKFVGVGTCSLTATVAATVDYTSASSTATTQSTSAPQRPKKHPTPGENPTEGSGTTTTTTHSPNEPPGTRTTIPPYKIPSSAPQTGEGGTAATDFDWIFFVVSGLALLLALWALWLAMAARRRDRRNH